ncbi:MAG: extracellular solute-binding protein [Candidatus Tectomicrobia bacterium]|uniref:Extracellular solute-binding protein n=1 Tax=Tectimicrobiota bacterium TaxID=2528274 RepID=A0A932GRM4_UNCTE|nr:extracellular solute-binding protein [Candidatus Tectomicrobia bacterium]
MHCGFRTGWRVCARMLGFLGILWAGAWLYPQGAAAASPGGAPAADPLARIVEGAKREGVVDVALQSSLTPQGVAAIQEGIRKKYGVDLKINYTPTRSYPRIQAQALTEHKAGTPPSHDLITLEDFRLFALAEAGAVERVDWGPYLVSKTPREVVVFGGSGLVVNTTYLGLLYNPKVVSPQEAPASLRDLTNPKWRGKVLVPPYPLVWMPLVIPLGRQTSLSVVEGIMKNGAVVAEWPTAINRFTLGEYPIVALISETFAHQLKAKGLSAGFRPMDVALMNQHNVAVRTGARHPNAAKLLAAFLAGPEALKIWQEVASAPNLHYRGQSLFELGPEWEGVRPWLWTPERVRYMSTPEAEAWEGEIGRLLTRK